MKHRPDSGDPCIDEVLVLAHLMRERANAELASCGLSLWTFKALKTLDKLGPSRSVDLGEAMGIAARTVTGAADALEAEGLVERRPHPTDRRAHLLVLTSEGTARLAEARKVHRALIERGGRGFAAGQREQLLALLAILEAGFAPVGAEASV